MLVEFVTLAFELTYIVSVSLSEPSIALSSIWQIALGILFGVLSLPWLYFAFPMGWALSFCSSFCIIIINIIWLIIDETGNHYLIYCGNILAYFLHLIFLNLPFIRHPFLELGNRTWLVLKRYPTVLPVKVWVGKKIYKGIMLDISRSGCKLRLGGLIHLGERLEVDISVAGNIDGEDLIKAAVLRRYGDDLGCRFIERIPGGTFRTFYQSLESRGYLKTEEAP